MYEDVFVKAPGIWEGIGGAFIFAMVGMGAGPGMMAVAFGFAEGDSMLCGRGLAPLG